DQAVEALRTGEERMRFALEAASVGIWDMDYTTGILRWSKTLEAQYGLQAGTFGGTFDAFIARVHPDDRASVAEPIGEAMTVGRAGSCWTRMANQCAASGSHRTSLSAARWRNSTIRRRRWTPSASLRAA